MARSRTADPIGTFKSRVGATQMFILVARSDEMKNIQIIDGALNCSYEIFASSDEDFNQFFPMTQQDVEFSDDFFVRLGPAAQEIWDRLWRSRVDKKSVNGIHGTLFCGLDEKKRFYPTKRESEMTTGLD